MDFRVTIHSGHGAPADALQLLWQQLEPNHEEAWFAKVGAEIRVKWGRDSPIAMERDEREDVGRLAVLGILREVCEDAPQLELGWYAVSPMR